MSALSEEGLSAWSLDRAAETIAEFRDSRDYPAKAGAMSALAIILHDEVLRLRAALAERDEFLAEAAMIMGSLVDDHNDPQWADIVNACECIRVVLAAELKEKQG